MVKSDPTLEVGADAYSDVLKVVGLRLKEARQKINLTQKELADRAGLKQSYVFELETGRTNISLRTLARMADVFEMDIRDFLPEGKSTPTSPAAFAMLVGVLEKLTEILQQREEEAAKRQAVDAQLVAELRSFAALKDSLARAAQPVQEPPTTKPSQSEAGRSGGEARRRTK
jgi:transcriptional regulator with XRE-family HTH domain